MHRWTYTSRHVKYIYYFYELSFIFQLHVSLTGSRRVKVEFSAEV